MAAADASATVAVARGPVKPAAANAARGAAKPTAADDDDADGLAVAPAASIATASAVPSSPATAPLAVASRLYTCGQGMGTTGTSVPRPRVLDPCQGFPQFMRLNACHHQNIFSQHRKQREGHSGFNG